MKLGKHSPRLDDRTVQFGNYLKADAPIVVPDSFYIGSDIPDWHVMGNDNLSDCCIAASGHMIMGWTDANKDLFTPSTDQIIAAYSAITGYDPATGMNDNGANMLDVLNYWRQTGIAGHKIGAYAAINPLNHDHVKQAIYMFGGVYAGMALPLISQKQDQWVVVPPTNSGPSLAGSWGGHGIPGNGYNPKTVRVITWGLKKDMDWDYLDCYCDELYVIISPDFLKNGVTIEGFNLAQLQADILQLTN